MEKKITICLLAIAMLSISFIACERNDVGSTFENRESIKVEDDRVLENFAKTLAIILSENKTSRELIKNEASKKINHDYDVLYMLAKDIDLGDGQSLENLLLGYMNADDLNFLTEVYPTLTFFVPSLPENSFSCESWNTQTEIPDVAIRSKNNSRTYCFDALGNEYFLEADEIPGYPIIVLKTNERIKVSSDDNTMALRSSTNANIQFEFIDDIFNNMLPKISTRQGVVDDNLKKAIESYDVFPNNTIGWQRDYVYYGLTKEKDRGPFDLRYKEHIVGFQLRGNIDGVLNKISDQEGDPSLISRYGWFEMRKKYPNQNPTSLTSWTDGEFEFEVTLKIVSKTLSDNAHSIKFRCAPERLFSVKTQSKTKGALWWRKTVYQITEINFLYVPLQVPLFEWNLENYGSSCELIISEYDDSEVFTTESSSTSEFATNFSFEPQFGENVKVGLKFGASNKESHSSKITIARTLKSDELGSVIINFGDEIIMSKDNYGVRVGTEAGSVFPKVIPDFNKKYFTSYYKIDVAPIYTGK